jgi:two-component system sensor histidine kinase KdpD
VAAETGILWILRDNLNVHITSLLYLLPVVIISRLFGLFPAILAASLSFLSFNYYFISPRFTLAVRQPQDLISLIVFLIIAIVISQLLDQDRQNIMAVIARERAITYLYELNLALTGVKDEKAIIQILAEKIVATFKFDRVEISLQINSNQKKIISVYDGVELINPFSPDLTIPISTARGEQETVCIWRSDAPFSTVEQQLLNTFVNQGIQALERAKLIETDNRTKILEESDKLKSSLLSSVSHELRTPLATIKAAISSVRSKTVVLDPESRNELLTVIEEETDHLNQLVGNLLDMSRIESGALNPQRGWNSLAEIIYGVIRRMSHIIQNHNIQIDIPEDLPLVPVDYMQIDQVFTNLLSNCAKYAPKGSEILIEIRPQDDQTVIIRVKNQSPHIAEEHLKRIFDKFYRVPEAGKNTGTGLGLSICKGIVEAHGGQIWARNEPDGFAFLFTLPLLWERTKPQFLKED